MSSRVNSLPSQKYSVTPLPAGAVKVETGAALQHLRLPPRGGPGWRGLRRARSACGRRQAGHATPGTPPPPPALAASVLTAAHWRARNPPRVPTRPPNPARNP